MVGLLLYLSFCVVENKPRMVRHMTACNIQNGYIAHIYTYIHMHACVCTHTHIPPYKAAHTHTHTQTHKHTQTDIAMQSTSQKLNDKRQKQLQTTHAVM